MTTTHCPTLHTRRVPTRSRGNIAHWLRGLLLLSIALTGTAAPPAGYRLAWSDEFDGSALDTNKWVYRTDSKHWSTQSPENVSVADGFLRLGVRKQSLGGKEYAGSGVISREAFKYGYYEARFRVPPGAGWHTSFWMQKHDGAGGTRPKAAVQELDVCENDSVNLRRYGVNIHCWNPEPHASFGGKSVATPDLAAEFHVFGCEFTPAKVKFYFDGELVQSADATQFPHGEQNIWLTTIASQLGGTKAVDDSLLPSAAVYDWVRYYKPDGASGGAGATDRRSFGKEAADTRAAASYDLNAVLQPVPATAKFSDPEFNIWCGSAIKGEDGRYHLYYSRWPRRLGHKAWVTHSEVAHAVSDAPVGPWKHEDVALPPRGTNFWDGSCTHNPTVLRIEGKYYLYYMGNYGDGVVRQPLNWEHRNRQRIGVAVADSPNGPWQRFDKPVLDVSSDTNAPDALVVTNPSVTQRAEGGVLMVYKAVGLKRALPFGGPVVHLVATADNPLGPFAKRPGEVFGAQGVMFAAEDPYIWRAKDRYWAVVKDNEGHFTGHGYSLALWESRDGITWDLSQHPLVTTPEIAWEDGRKQKLAALERPQVLIENGVPVVMCCAAADNQNRDGSFNIQIPLRGAK